MPTVTQPSLQPRRAARFGLNILADRMSASSSSNLEPTAAATLVANLNTANARLESAWTAADEEHWRTGIGLRTYGAASLPEFVFLRWREVELHMIDLGLSDLGGPDWSAVSDSYLEIETQVSLRTLPSRLPEQTPPCTSFPMSSPHTSSAAYRRRRSRFEVRESRSSAGSRVGVGSLIGRRLPPGSVSHKPGRGTVTAFSEATLPDGIARTP